MDIVTSALGGRCVAEARVLPRPCPPSQCFVVRYSLSVATTQTRPESVLPNTLTCPLRPDMQAVVMGRKLAVVTTTVFLVGGDEQTAMLEVLVLVGILIISVLLQIIFRPHHNSRLFRCAAQRGASHISVARKHICPLVARKRRAAAVAEETNAHYCTSACAAAAGWFVRCPSCFTPAPCCISEGGTCSLSYKILISTALCPPAQARAHRSDRQLPHSLCAAGTVIPLLLLCKAACMPTV